MTKKFQNQNNLAYRASEKSRLGKVEEVALYLFSLVTLLALEAKVQRIKCSLAALEARGSIPAVSIDLSCHIQITFFLSGLRW